MSKWGLELPLYRAHPPFSVPARAVLQSLRDFLATLFQGSIQEPIFPDFGAPGPPKMELKWSQF